MLFGFGEQGFNPHRFVMNELEEPSALSTPVLYKLNYAGLPSFSIVLWRLFSPNWPSFFQMDMDGIRAFYRYIGDLYFNVITLSHLCSPLGDPNSQGAWMFIRHRCAISSCSRFSPKAQVT